MKELFSKSKAKLKQALRRGASPQPKRSKNDGTKQSSDQVRPVAASKAPILETTAEQSSIVDLDAATGDSTRPQRTTPLPSETARPDIATQIITPPSQATPSDESAVESSVVEEGAPDGKPLETEAAPLLGNPKPRSDHWNAALSRINDDERKTLEELRLGVDQLEASSTPMEGLGVNDETPFHLASLAAEKIKRLDDKAWKFRFRGRDIILRDVAGKIVLWLGKFKDVGDVVVNYDPAHAALPWAAIRFLLSAATAEQELAGHMLIGSEKVCCLLARCQTYRKLYLDVESYRAVESATQLEETLICLYAQILSLLAHLVALTNRSLGRRMIHAISNPSGLSEWITKLENLEWRIEAEASNCERESRSSADAAWNQRYGNMEQLLSQHILLSKEERTRFLAECRADERFEILLWISDIQYEADHYNARSGRTDGTGEWLLADQVYRDWRTTSASICLWLHGKPGAGKTKLSTKLVDELVALNESERSDDGLAYFYCDQNREKYHDPVWVLRSFIRQLSASKSDTTIAKCVRDKYTQMKAKGFASVLSAEDCAALLLELVNVFPRTTFVLDGLDECDRKTRHTLMDTLDDLVKTAKHPVKVFIASREDEDLADRYSRTDHLKVDASRNRGDIVKFVLERMQGSRYCRTRMSQSVREQILNTFRAKSDGMFQWAALHIQELLELERDSDVLQYLNDVPVGLKAAYDKIYDGIISQRGSKKHVAIAAMKWVLCSTRPLSPEELVIAASQDPDGEFNENIDLEPPYLLDACHNLIEVFYDGRSEPRWVSPGEAQLFQRISVKHQPSMPLQDMDTTYIGGKLLCRFSHYSVVEYLLKHKWVMPDLHAFATRVCLRTMMRFSIPDRSVGSDEDEEPYDGPITEYCSPRESYSRVERLLRYMFFRLLREDFNHLPLSESIRRLDDLIPRNRFDLVKLEDQSPQGWLRYAMAGWYSHLELAEGIWTAQDGQGATRSLLETFFNHPTRGSPSYRAWALLHNPLNWLPCPSPIATLSGFQRFYPAAWCAAAGMEQPLARWIDQGLLDLNFASIRFPRHTEPASGTEIPSPSRQSLLSTAVWNGRYKICKLLVSHGARDDFNGIWESSLEMAIRSKRDDIVELILNNGSEIPLYCSRGPMLHLAAHLGTLETVKFLVQKGADIEERAKSHNLGWNLTALEIACLHVSSEEIGIFLADQASDIQNHHPAALLLAAMTDKADLVHHLAFLGADIEAPLPFLLDAEPGLANPTETPILTATRRYSERTDMSTLRADRLGVRALLECGANPNVIGSDGLTPLQIAMENLDHNLIVPLVLFGADTNVKFPDGTTILQVACRKGNLSLVRFLIDRGAGVAEVSGPWRTALFAAYWNVIRSGAVLRKLQERYIYTRPLDRLYTQGPNDEDSGASGHMTEDSEEWSDYMSDEERGSLTNERSERMSGKGINDHSGETIDNRPGEKSERLTNQAVAGSQGIMSIAGNAGGSSDSLGSTGSMPDSNSGAPDSSEGGPSSSDGYLNFTTCLPRFSASLGLRKCLRVGLLEPRTNSTHAHTQLRKGGIPDCLPDAEEPGAAVQLLLESGAEFKVEDYTELGVDFQQEVELLGVLVDAYTKLMHEQKRKVTGLRDRFRRSLPRQSWETAERRFLVHPSGRSIIEFRM
ncbi:hypothetical protein BKA56DRAFT_560140 [Ilyonectria sp. MPI-CAGE-AT-0026]|nr:hypothetical protein BKA56DRAFT_560140 [Ilyonectria sp. MPI-CAGE-AT-0026]